MNTATKYEVPALEGASISSFHLYGLAFHQDGASIWYTIVSSLWAGIPSGWDVHTILPPLWAQGLALQQDGASKWYTILPPLWAVGNYYYITLIRGQKRLKVSFVFLFPQVKGFYGFHLFLVYLSLSLSCFSLGFIHQYTFNQFLIHFFVILFFPGAPRPSTIKFLLKWHIKSFETKNWNSYSKIRNGNCEIGGEDQMTTHNTLESSCQKLERKEERKRAENNLSNEHYIDILRREENSARKSNFPKFIKTHGASWGRLGVWRKSWGYVDEKWGECC